MSLFVEKSETHARIDDKVYFYLSSRKPIGEEVVEDISLYEIDTINNTLKKIFTEDLNRTLIYVDVLNNNLLSIKGDNQDNKTVTFIDTIDLSKSKVFTQEILLSKEYNNIDNSGELIYNFAKQDDFIYTLEFDTKEENGGYIIRKYNESGQSLRNIILEKKITDLINNEPISDFEIVGQYAFIRNFSGKGIVCNISNDIAAAKVIGSETLDIAFASNGNENSDYSLLFQRGTDLLLLLDSKNNVVSKLDTAFANGYDNIRYMYINQENNMLIAIQNKEEMSHFFLNYLDIPVLETQSLETDHVLLY